MGSVRLKLIRYQIILYTAYTHRHLEILTNVRGKISTLKYWQMCRGKISTLNCWPMCGGKTLVTEPVRELAKAMLCICVRARWGVGNIKYPLVWLLILVFRSSHFIASVTVLLTVLKLPSMALAHPQAFTPFLPSPESCNAAIRRNTVLNISESWNESPASGIW